MHPEFTNYRHFFKENIDYIFYTPNVMKVTKLLDVPDMEANILHGENYDLPSAIFPSDHFRIAAEFEVYYQ